MATAKIAGAEVSTDHFIDGKRVGSKRTFQVCSPIDGKHLADRALKLNDEKIDSPEVVNHVRYDPAGVGGLITPWNGPFMLTTWKVGPCLAAGNTAVVKPPEWAPLTCSMMADLAAEAGIPP